MDSDTSTHESGREFGGKVLTLEDRGAGIQARVEVDRTGDGPPRVVDIRLRSTDGHGLRAEDLLVLEELGLRLPVSADVYVTPKPEPAAVEAAEPAAAGAAPAAPTKAPATVPGPRKGAPGKKTTPAKTSPAKTSPKKDAKSGAKKTTPAKKAVPAPAQAQSDTADGGRVYRLSPPVDELDALFRECNGSTGAMADKLGVPRHTIHGWLKRHRREGHVFPDIPAGEPVGAATGGEG